MSWDGRNSRNIGWTTVTNHATSGDVKYRVLDRVVYLHVNAYISVPTATDTTLVEPGIIPNSVVGSDDHRDACAFSALAGLWRLSTSSGLVLRQVNGVTTGQVGIQTCWPLD